jgi:LysM repeat protein
MFKKYRIKSHLRFCIFLTLVLILTIITTGTVLGFNESAGITKEQYTEVKIIVGDTLWDLAKSYGPKDKDIRRTVHRICKINDISAHDIQPGQSILIPIN